MASGTGPADQDRNKKSAPVPAARAESRVLLLRFWRTWVAHRKRQLVLALLLMAALAAATGAYPQIIKYAFDVLTNGRLELIWLIMGVIVLVTALRSLFLYLTAIVTNRIVWRIAVDIQKQAFAHLCCTPTMHA